MYILCVRASVRKAEMELRRSCLRSDGTPPIMPSLRWYSADEAFAPMALRR